MERAVRRVPTRNGVADEAQRWLDGLRCGGRRQHTTKGLVCAVGMLHTCAYFTSFPHHRARKIGVSAFGTPRLWFSRYSDSSLIEKGELHGHSFSLRERLGTLPTPYRRTGQLEWSLSTVDLDFHQPESQSLETPSWNIAVFGHFSRKAHTSCPHACGYGRCRKLMSIYVSPPSPETVEGFAHKVCWNLCNLM